MSCLSVLQSRILACSSVQYMPTLPAPTVVSQKEQHRASSTVLDVSVLALQGGCPEDFDFAHRGQSYGDDVCLDIGYSEGQCALGSG